MRESNYFINYVNVHNNCWPCNHNGQLQLPVAIDKTIRVDVVSAAVLWIPLQILRQESRAIADKPTWCFRKRREAYLRRARLTGRSRTRIFLTSRYEWPTRIVTRKHPSCIYSLVNSSAQLADTRKAPWRHIFLTCQKSSHECPRIDFSVSDS